ncbi:hypothetical protein HOLleu_04521 [Holothuria leucospilota]|uniref:Uncharacterized protein n=1 Tax=Holothuria leucospilota TaxID=206669 RepID=A0A9Q1CUG0_HOLLE|nr:hypothetical protein HOLleu_04521 [Holothuria leucospilota]
MDIEKRIQIVTAAQKRFMGGSRKACEMLAFVEGTCTFCSEKLEDKIEEAHSTPCCLKYQTCDPCMSLVNDMRFQEKAPVGDERCHVCGNKFKILNIDVNKLSNPQLINYLVNFWDTAVCRKNLNTSSRKKVYYPFLKWRLGLTADYPIKKGTLEQYTSVMRLMNEKAETSPICEKRNLDTLLSLEETTSPNTELDQAISNLFTMEADIADNGASTSKRARLSEPEPEPFVSQSAVIDHMNNMLNSILFPVPAPSISEEPLALIKKTPVESDLPLDMTTLFQEFFTAKEDNLEKNPTAKDQKENKEEREKEGEDEAKAKDEKRVEEEKEEDDVSKADEGYSSTESVVEISDDDEDGSEPLEELLIKINEEKELLQKAERRKKRIRKDKT